MRATSNAVRSVCSSFSGSVTRNTCFAHADMMLKTGASWKASLPIAARGTCPLMSTTGTESPLQSAIGVTALVAPGPDVTMNTPTFPLARA